MQNPTYNNYPWRGMLACTGVDTHYSADVRFSYSNITEGIFAPVTDTGMNTVYIYSATRPYNSVSVPVIICTYIG